MQNKNREKPYGIIGLGIVIIVILAWFMLSYNTLVNKEEQVRVAWSQVESNLQRKVDLLPNLVKVVKKYANHEEELLTKIAELRSNALKTLSSQKENVDAVQKIQKSLDASMMKLFAVAENYPELKSSEQFLQLQSQIEGAENRINISRMQFNTAVGDYNAYRKTMPANMVASLGGFMQKAYFKADDQAHKKFEVEM